MKVLAIIPLVILQAVAQKICAPTQQGPYLGTQPTIIVNAKEATEQDLRNGDPLMYGTVLPLHGKHYSGDWNLETLDFTLVDPLDYFQVQRSGNSDVFTLKKSLDRDGPTSALDDDMTFFGATIKCVPTNGDPAVTYDFQIFIDDVNDNKPTLPAIEETVSEAAPVGSILFTVKADDKDLNLDKNITYSLETHNDMFSIDPETGDVTLTTGLDYETMGQNKYLELVIKAEDGGPESLLTAQTTAVVHVEDADDMGPAYIYQGCFQAGGVCAWPKYTTGLTLVKDKPIIAMPVPNKINGPVSIAAHDRDTAMGDEILFSIASTIPPGQENKFKLETQKGNDNEYIAIITPVMDATVQEGFEIFLNAQEKSGARRSEMAMIFFTGGTQSGSSSEEQNQVQVKEDDFTTKEVSLIAVTAILATLVLCMGVALLCLLCRKRGNKSADFS